MKVVLVLLLDLLPASAICQETYQCVRVARMDFPRKQNCSICVADSTVIVFGGFDGKKMDRHFYSLKHDKLTPLDLKYPGIDCALNITFYADSTLYVGGGMDSNLRPYSHKEFWKYDFRQNSWSRLGNLPFQYLGRPGVHPLEDGSTFVAISRFIDIGVSPLTSIYRYSAEDDFWMLESDCPDSKLFHSRTFVIADELYIFFEADGYANRFSGALKKYNFLTREWTSLARFPFNERIATFAFTDGQNGFVGGGTFQEPLNDIYVYDPKNDHWSPAATLDRTLVFGSTWTIGT